MKKLIIIFLFLFISCLPQDLNKNKIKKFKIKKPKIIKVYSLYNNGYKDSIREYEYKITCLEGHTYYERSDVHNGYLAIKLDSRGIPVKCGVNKKEN